MSRLGVLLAGMLVAAVLGMPTVAVPAVAAPPKENSAAIEFLTKRGLVRSNFTWLSPQEAKLKAYLDGLRGLETGLKEAEATIAAGFQNNEALKAEIAQLEARLKQINEALQSGKLQGDKAQQAQTLGKQIADRINELAPKVVDPSGFDENQEVKNAIIRLVEARNQATLAVLFIRQNATTVAESYEKLAANKDISEALAALGGKHKLGPLKNYERDLKRIEKLEKQVLTASLPTYRDNTMFRVSAIVNDQAAATFTYLEQANVTYIPSSVATAGGVEIPEDAPKVLLQAEGERKIEARQIKLPKLRFGKYVVEDVEVLVLAPDAEDLGAILSPKSLAGFKPNLDVAKLEFSLTPLGGAAEGNAVETPAARKPRGAGRDKKD